MLSVHPKHAIIICDDPKHCHKGAASQAKHFDMRVGIRRCVWWGYSHPGVELGRMSLARHGLYMRVAGKLAALGVKYTLPPYQVLSPHIYLAW
jgi:hypothetical protein